MADQNPSGLPALDGDLQDDDLLFASRNGIDFLRTTWAILKAQILGLFATVAKTGAYADLSGKPNIPAGKADIGLANVDNTADANKPVSNAQAQAISAAVAKESPPSTTANATRNLAAADVNALVKVDSAVAVVLTIMNDATLLTSDDEVIATYQVGVGIVSFAAGPGVALRAPAGVTASVQYGSKGVQRVGINEWALLG